MDMLPPLRLTHIDPNRNMRRFYRLSLERTLFGEVTLVRTWGRIGTHGQTMFQTYDRLSEAEITYQELRAAKEKKGYRSDSVNLA